MQTTQTNIDDSTESAEGSLLEGLVLELGMGATTPEVDLASATAPLSDETLDARAERLLTQNRGLVIWFANRYARDAQEREDLIAEGMLGALRAARRFDPTRGVPFGAYAAPWIKRSVLEAVARFGMGTIPTLQADVDVTRRRRVYLQQAAASNGQGATPTMTAASLGISIAKEMELSAVERARPLDFGVDKGSIDCAAAEETPRLDGLENLALVRSAVAQLGGREAEVVELRFGMRGGGAKDLREIAVILGMKLTDARDVLTRAQSRLTSILRRKMDSNGELHGAVLS